MTWTQTAGVVTALGTALALTPTVADGATSPTLRPPVVAERHPDGPPGTAPTPRRAEAHVSDLTTSPRTTLEPCEDDPAWLCGTVDVPLDRADPQGHQIALAFAVLPHSGSGSGKPDPYFITGGGPGGSNLADLGFLGYYIGGGVNEKRDLVIVEHRGTGQSGPIDCPELQALVYPFDRQELIEATTQCGQELGDDADRYGSGDIAMDMDAVRAALGYRRINLYGMSYGGAFLSAYATRFADRLRSLVIDAGLPVTDPGHVWEWGTGLPVAQARQVALLCERAPACDAAQPRARSTLAYLAHTLEQGPVEGAVPVTGGGTQQVELDERGLMELGYDWSFARHLAAAGQALRRGDTTPLLQLQVESLRRLPTEPDDPDYFSFGANAATFCNDQDMVWSRNDPVDVRQAKLQEAVDRKIADDAFTPYRTETWTDYFQPDMCIGWPAPDRFTPAVAKGATVRDVPTLIMSGDIDTNVATSMTRKLLRVFPHATFRRIAGAGHPTVGWSDCAWSLATDFVTRPAATPDSCRRPTFVGPTTSSFPATAGEATPAAPLPHNAATRLERCISTAAVQAVRDDWIRAFGDDRSVGFQASLRGGRSHFDFAPEEGPKLRLLGSRFAQDVAVTGRSRWLYDGNVTTITVDVDGPGGHDGHLHARGEFGAGQPYRDFVVVGTLGGRHVAVRVPAN